ncbi:Lipid A core-O-antigen ligase and related enzymes [Mycobacterium tuberculosis]|nr:Lipid A core-O-antigen ligase and related enzymes [Mycobacterium tuberculosis]
MPSISPASAATETAPGGPVPPTRTDEPLPVRLRDLPLTTWPLIALLIGFPVWWLLGLGVFSFVICAVPMALVLLNRRPLRFPPGFGLWVLFLIWYLVSCGMLDENPPGAYGDLDFGRVVSVLVRLVVYLASAVIALYVGNLSERELPRLALIRMLGALFITTTLGGLLGVFFPNFHITPLFGMLLPGKVRTNAFVQNIIDPTAAQITWVGSVKAIRPEAPFEWANTWGNNYSILLIWFILGWWVYASRERRVIGVVILALSLIPVVYGLNRGLWVGIALSALYVLFRLALRGRVMALGVAGMALVLGGALFVMSPLYAQVETRLDNPQSNSIRAYTRAKTIEAALTSPIIGYGNTRYSVGSDKTVTTGKTQACPQCKHPPLGSDGQLWLLLISQGLVGAGLYVLFFLNAIRRYWRDTSAIATGGVLTMLLVLFYMTIYDGLYTPMPLYLLSFAVMWRNGIDLSPPRIQPVAVRAKQARDKALNAARRRRLLESKTRRAALAARTNGTPMRIGEGRRERHNGPADGAG